MRKLENKLIGGQWSDGTSEAFLHNCGSVNLVLYCHVNQMRELRLGASTIQTHDCTPGKFKLKSINYKPISFKPYLYLNARTRYWYLTITNVLNLELKTCEETSRHVPRVW